METWIVRCYCGKWITHYGPFDTEEEAQDWADLNYRKFEIIMVASP
jgi:hypothetical protein